METNQFRITRKTVQIHSLQSLKYDLFMIYQFLGFFLQALLKDKSRLPRDRVACSILFQDVFKLISLNLTFSTLLIYIYHGSHFTQYSQGDEAVNPVTVAANLLQGTSVENFVVLQGSIMCLLLILTASAMALCLPTS